MASIFHTNELSFNKRSAPLPEFAFSSTDDLWKSVKASRLDFDVRRLEPGVFSYPYHFHRNAEEMFVILSGRALLRAPEGITEVKEGDILFFESGPAGAHQLYNHTDQPCTYLDLSTLNGLDIAEYPDSGKINILPDQDIYHLGEKSDYYDGEERVREIWGTLGYPASTV
ncbi:hypothetical protein PSTEL_15285 [Paenibacillus stellifer]|uniref:Cupin type-2 domain-containing protein n=1 Tax=Paenibacillus stellifer TaxID=169760 RepID=A0A089LVT2_9BACL|nr:cupin domain-containing protein [Paenibacillus stellifer]AIQ64245.1 hypothetical protein PSTEL_15285 [Paenibacillus stellifer]